MQYPPQFQPQGSSPRTRKLVWALAGAIILVAALVVIVIVLLTKPGTTSTAPEPGIGTQDTRIPQGAQAPLVNVYTGSSMNHTATQFGMDGSAKLELRFTDKNPQALAGEIDVDGRDVGGTGLFEGTLSGNRITLNISPQDGTPPFQLTGTLMPDGSIQGSLAVPLGELSQSGEWQVQPRQ